MKPLTRPDNLSENAFRILIAAYEHYARTEDKDFDIKDHFGLSRIELEACLKELHENRYVFWEQRGEPDEYIYILAHKLFLYSPYNK